MSLNEKLMLCTAVGFSASVVVCAVIAMAIRPDLKRMRTRGRG